MKLASNPLYTLLTGTEQLTVLASFLDPDIHPDYSLVPVEQFMQATKKASYSEWGMRKLTAIPLAISSGVITATYHLAARTLLKLWSALMRVELKDRIQTHLFLQTQAQNEGYGRLISLFHDKLGLYWIHKGHYNQACLAQHQTRSIPLELFHEQLYIDKNPYDAAVPQLFPVNDEGKARFNCLPAATLKALYPLFQPAQFFALLNPKNLNLLDYSVLSSCDKQVMMDVIFSSSLSDKEIQLKLSLLSPSNLRALQAHFLPIHYRLLPPSSFVELDFSKLTKSQFTVLVSSKEPGTRKSQLIPLLNERSLKTCFNLFQSEDFYYLNEAQLQYLDFSRLPQEKISFALRFKVPKELPSPSPESIWLRIEALPKTTPIDPLLRALRDQHDFDTQAALYYSSTIRTLIRQGRITELPADDLRSFFVTHGLSGRCEIAAMDRISFIDHFLGVYRFYEGQSSAIGTKGTVIHTQHFSYPTPDFMRHTLLGQLLKLDELEPLYPELYKSILLRLVVFGYLRTQEEFTIMLSLDALHQRRIRRYLPYALELAAKNKDLERAITPAHWALLHPSDFGSSSLVSYLNYDRFRILMRLGPKSTSTENHPVSEDSKERYRHLVATDVLATSSWLSLSELSQLLTETQKANPYVHLLVRHLFPDRILGTGIPLLPHPSLLNTTSAPISIPDSKNNPRYRLLCAAPVLVRGIDDAAHVSDSVTDSDTENYRRWGSPPVFRGFDKT